MTITIKRTDGILEYFSSEAKKELKNQVDLYADLVIKEADVVESASSYDKKRREFTSNHVICATQNVQKMLPKRRRKTIAKVVSALSFLFLGLFLDMCIQDSNPSIFLIICTCFCGTVAGVSTYIGEREET